MIEYSRIKKLHFIGIGGSGMSGIAEVLHNMGFIISGSDIAESDSVNRLRKMGIKVFPSHDKNNVKDVETVVYSSAVKKNNVEVREALSRKIPVIPRAEMLAELMRVKYSIAVAGTHGKTTTTSMIACVLSIAKKDPTYVVGGKLKVDESGAKLGRSDYLIAEADESDGSFLKLFPTLAVITNIEDDHLDYYGNMDNLKEAFVRFGNKVPFYGSVILNYQCKNSREILPLINKRVSTFSLSSNTRVRARDVKTTAVGASFNLIVDDINHGKVKLNVGGKHNVSNALAAITALIDMGIDVGVIKEGLKKFNLPERRFQILSFNDDYMIIDDYAHHPSEIEVTIKTLRSSNFKRVIAVFQPHRFTRLKILMEKFSSCFNNADKLIITKLYSANQSEIKNVNSKILVKMIKKTGFSDVVYIESFKKIIEYLEGEIRKGDAVVFLSAGNLTDTAHEFSKVMEETRR